MKQKEDEIRFGEIISDLPEKDRSYLKKAYDFSKQAHEGQFRKSGEPYFVHPLTVCIELYDKFQDIELSAAGLLHDTVEDCKNVTQEIIYKEFGDNVGYIVDSISKNKKCFLGEKLEFNDERDKMLYGGMRNIGCILVKIADRNHNLATLSHMPAHKQIKKSFESQAIYIPLMCILNYNEEKINIEKADKSLKNYLDTNNINSYEILKNKLMNHCFNDFNEELFKLIYSNSSNIVWKIENENIYKKLLNDNNFIENIEVIHTAIGKNNFCVIFRYIKGAFFSNSFSKLSIVNKFYT